LLHGCQHKHQPKPALLLKNRCDKHAFVTKRLSRRDARERNYGGYCNPQLDELIDRQSREPDRDKRRQLVWEIERRLAEDNVRPVIFYARQATCRQPRVKGLTLMVNSIYNGSRFDDLWLED
jgi:ABC-type transport system substrate-binding protein